MSLTEFGPATRAWFEGAFAAPTAPQREAWAVIRRGGHALVVAPTGSGKTLAAFLWSLDRLAREPPPADPRARCRVVYVSPLKALAVDVERNLTAPLTGMRHAAQRLGEPIPQIAVAVRTGDTPADARRAFARAPADILITTPESLFLLLTSAARQSLRGVDTVIVDEVHAVAGTKRGAHLALSLERLDALLPRPAQRIGLSATVRPVDEVARFLGGCRPVSVVAPPTRRELEVTVSSPVPDMAQPGSPDDGGGNSLWPALDRRVVELIRGHRSTIVFANSRRLAERLCARIGDIGEEAGVEGELARAHHGSVSREQRKGIEEALKAGRLPAVVATSSLELGIDMGAVDLVVQVESPPSVASGLQRFGRAGHQVGAVSRGVLLPKYRGDLVAAAVVAERMAAGAIEELRYPRNPLDVLAQQIVAMVAVEDWPVDALAALVRRAANFAGLAEPVFEAVLDMLSGRYPSDDFAELRPRLHWDRVAESLSARPGAQRLAVTSGGTIPDRGLFGVFLVGGSRVGELDEEMVYESRVGDVFALGSSSWRIEEITHDRVLVTPAPGEPAKVPFWKGDTPGRPLELGRALGAFVREMAALPAAAAQERARAAGLDDFATDNLLRYLGEQQAACGVVPDDRTVVVERFRDELGDWRICVHSPFGATVNAPWALVLSARLRERYGVDAGAMHSDDGIVIRLPDTESPPGADAVVFEPDEVSSLVTEEVAGSTLFASRFRECAARALLLPRRDPSRRAPLWQQRQRASQLLSVAARFDSFPIVLETLRECLQDVFDVPGLVALMSQIGDRSIHVVEVETAQPSPFARSLLFGYIGAFMYEGDAPLAERRAQALSLDSALLAELLGQAELRELLDPDALDSLAAELSRATPERQARSLEGVVDLLREIGDLTTAEAIQRGATPAWLAELEEHRRALRVRIAGEERWIAVEDAGRALDALGVPLPVGVPEAFLEPVPDPLADLVSRYARTHGPFTERDPATRFGLDAVVVGGALARLAALGRVVRGEFRPGGTDLEWCDVEVLRRLRRRSLARLRRDVEPVPATALARFLPAWHGVAAGAVAGGAGSSGVGGPARAAAGAAGTPVAGAPALGRALESLAGLPVPASALESLVLPLRVAGYTPAMLDELAVAGELVWAGAGSLPGRDGWVTLCPADLAPLLLPHPDPAAVSGPVHEAVLAALTDGRALFFRTLSDQVGSLADAELVTAVWDLVWGGWVTNDTLAPLRALLRHGGSRATSGGASARPLSVRPAPRSRLGGSAYGSGYRRGRPAMPARGGPPSAAGRWSLLPERDADPTRRAHALAEALLERHGVLTRGAVAAEHPAGGFAGVYPVLRALEEAGRIRRGYFVEGLGAAQFALPGAVDRLRAAADRGVDPPAWAAPVPSGRRSRRPEPGAGTLVLAAADPANPYGAALPWPERPDGASGHRPGRKAGALVVLVECDLALYVERGGASLLTWTEDPARLTAAVDALALAVRDGLLGRLTVERADGLTVLETPLGDALRASGFHATPKGLRLRA